MYAFEVGDRVVVIVIEQQDSECGISVGDTGIVYKIEDDGSIASVKLDESYIGEHSSYSGDRCSSKCEREVAFLITQLEKYCEDK